MSEGMKNHSTLNELELFSNTLGYANLAPSKYDFHYVVSLYESKYVNPININLIYTYSSKNITFLLGNGMNLSCYMYLSSISGNQILLKLPDGRLPKSMCEAITSFILYTIQIDFAHLLLNL